MMQPSSCTERTLSAPRSPGSAAAMSPASCVTSPPEGRRVVLPPIQDSSPLQLHSGQRIKRSSLRREQSQPSLCCDPVSTRLQVINGRGNLVFDPQSGMARVLTDVRFRPRHCGPGRIDEPTAILDRPAALLPLFQDIADVLEAWPSTVEVVRFFALMGEPVPTHGAGGGSARDKWRLALTKNRADLVAKALQDFGVPRARCRARVELRNEKNRDEMILVFIRDGEGAGGDRQACSSMGSSVPAQHQALVGSPPSSPHVVANSVAAQSQSVPPRSAERRGAGEERLRRRLEDDADFELPARHQVKPGSGCRLSRHTPSSSRSDSRLHPGGFFDGAASQAARLEILEHGRGRGSQTPQRGAMDMLMPLKPAYTPSSLSSHQPKSTSLARTSQRHRLNDLGSSPLVRAGAAQMLTGTSSSPALLRPCA